MSEPLRVVWDEAVRRHGDPHAYRPDLCRCGTFDCEVRAAVLTPAHTLDLDSPEMVERLARALRDTTGAGDYVGVTDEEWSRRAARVLAALREQDTPPAAPLDEGVIQRAHIACCWCGEHHEEGE